MRAPSLPIVLLTADVMSHYVAEYRETGVDGVVTNRSPLQICWPSWRGC